MPDAEQFAVQMEHLEGYEFKVRFEGLDVQDLVVDEPAPLGHGKGPNPSRLVAAAVGNCLSASLLFCLGKARQQPDGLRARVTGTMQRNEKGRLRIGDMTVRIELDGVADRADRLGRCLELFEDYCVVTESIRRGIPVSVEVVDENGQQLFERGR